VEAAICRVQTPSSSDAYSLVYVSLSHTSTITVHTATSTLIVVQSPQDPPGSVAMENTAVDGRDTGRTLHPSSTRLHDAAQPLAGSSLSFNNVAFSLSAAGPHLTLSPAPRLPNPYSSMKGKPRRPSTASAAEDKWTMLPSSSSSSIDLTNTNTAASTPSLGSQDGESALMSDSIERPSLQEVNKNAIEAVAGLRAEASRLAGGGQ
jgi:hypothetical protein